MNDVQPTVAQAFKVHEAFCKVTLDAYIVLDKHGTIVNLNPMFGQICGIKPKQILKTGDLSKILSFSHGEAPLNFLSLLEKGRVCHLNKVNAQIVGNTPKEMILNVGFYPFEDGGSIIGGFVIFRDITAESELVDKNKDRESESLTDALTGACNRNFVTKYLEQEVPQMLLQAKSGKSPDFSLIMADIDFFKKVNDVYGHVGGDITLQKVVASMRKSLRSSDIISRYGGEEFLLLLPQTRLEGAVEAAKKINKNIEALEITHEDITFKVTVSLGVSQWVVGQEKFTEAVERADLALYDSKHNGRNQVTYSSQVEKDFINKKAS